jgi:flavin reductase (DIM6/NTAB) family NADH-FMN oxidoreductase RutF
MTKTYHKKNFPVDKIRQFIEPGPIVLVSSAWKDKLNIMTMGWHCMMEFTPSLFGCIISNANESFEMIRRSRECVINIPTFDMIDTVIGIGNSSGKDIQKFEKFGLTPVKGRAVTAPLIKECYANFECRLIETRLINKYNFFIFQVLKARVATAPKYPRTVHYRGDGVFMVSGKEVSYRKRFKPQNL